MIPRRARSGGYNLLEVIIATMIFLTALLLLLGVWRAHHSVLTRSRNQLTASSLATSALEQRMASGYEALTSILDAPQVQTFDSKSQIRGRFMNTTFKTTFLATQSPTIADVRRLSATVEWDESSGHKTVTYETSLFKAN